MENMAIKKLKLKLKLFFSSNKEPLKDLRLILKEDRFEGAIKELLDIAKTHK